MYEVMKLLEEVVEETMELPFYRQGTVNEYDETFVTYWITENTLYSYYDNSPNAQVVTANVNLYTSDIENAYDIASTLCDELWGAGFEVTNNGIDIESDEETHIGIGIDVMYRKDNV